MRIASLPPLRRSALARLLRLRSSVFDLESAAARAGARWTSARASPTCACTACRRTPPLLTAAWSAPALILDLRYPAVRRTPAIPAGSAGPPAQPRRCSSSSAPARPPTRSPRSATRAPGPHHPRPAGAGPRRRTLRSPSSPRPIAAPMMRSMPAPRSISSSARRSPSSVSTRPRWPANASRSDDSAEGRWPRAPFPGPPAARQPPGPRRGAAAAAVDRRRAAARRATSPHPAGAGQAAAG